MRGKDDKKYIPLSNDVANCLTIGKENIEKWLFEKTKIRRLTPIECERLQGFPDGWTKYGKEYKYVKLFGNTWQDKNVQLKNVKDISLIENQNSALCITSDGKNGEIQTSFIQKKEKIKDDVKLEGAIEMLTAKNSVCDIINLGKDIVMLYNQKKTKKIDILTKENHILEKMEEKSTYPLWKITLNEKSKKEKSFIISILIKEIIESKIFSYAKTVLKYNSVDNNPKGKCPGDFWDITTQPFTSYNSDLEHFAVFPEELIIKPIKASTPPGGLVLDPFCGRGTVGRVAKQLGLNYVMFDINPKYCELARLYINGQKRKLIKHQQKL